MNKSASLKGTSLFVFKNIIRIERGVTFFILSYIRFGSLKLILLPHSGLIVKV